MKKVKITAVQKICDSFRITDDWKEKLKKLRPA